jgi:hypothetical protein
MKSLALLLLLVPLQSSEFVATSYDRFKNRTTVSTKTLLFRDSKPVNPDDRPPYLITVSASFTFPGNHLRKEPVGVDLAVHSLEPSLRFYRDGSSFIALADGLRLILPEIVGGGRVGICRIPFAQFKKMAKASRLEIQIGDQEFEIPAETLQAFRDLESNALINRPRVTR